jgi:predicted methyltransferase
MYKEPRPMREIHEIQQRLYEEEKNLSAEDRIAKIHREAEDVIKKYGLKLKKAAHVS